jgi:hypothetical protein
LLVSSPLIGCILALLLATTAHAAASIAGVGEYQMKALYLFKFAQFVEWPAAAFAHGSDPIHICVAGENPFGSLLQTVIADKQASGRHFHVREVRPGKQPAGCHVLFVPASQSRRQTAILAGARGLHVLTVGESADFLEAGGVIVLRLNGARLRFGIALEAAQSAGLKVSSKLLQLADGTTVQRPE